MINTEDDSDIATDQKGNHKKIITRILRRLVVL